MTGRRDSYKKRRKQQPKVLRQFFPDWQDRQAHCLQTLLYASPVFSRDIAALRKSADSDIRSKAAYIVAKYGKFGLRPYALPMIAHYIEHNEVNPLHMFPAAVAVSTKENIAGPAIAYNDGRGFKAKLDKEMAERAAEWVYLVIQPDATKEDLLEWIENYYDFFLKERLQKLDPSRPKRIKTSDPEKLKRDMDIYEHIVVNGEPAKTIAEKYDLDAEHARKLAAAIKKKLIEPEK